MNIWLVFSRNYSVPSHCRIVKAGKDHQGKVSFPSKIKIDMCTYIRLLQKIERQLNLEKTIHPFLKIRHFEN